MPNRGGFAFYLKYLEKIFKDTVKQGIAPPHLISLSVEHAFIRTPEILTFFTGNAAYQGIIFPNEKIDTRYICHPLHLLSA